MLELAQHRINLCNSVAAIELIRRLDLAVLEYLKNSYCPFNVKNVVMERKVEITTLRFSKMICSWKDGSIVKILKGL